MRLSLYLCSSRDSIGIMQKHDQKSPGFIFQQDPPHPGTRGGKLGCGEERGHFRI